MYILLSYYCENLNNLKANKYIYDLCWLLMYSLCKNNYLKDKKTLMRVTVILLILHCKKKRREKKKKKECVPGFGSSLRIMYINLSIFSVEINLYFLISWVKFKIQNKNLQAGRCRINICGDTHMTNIIWEYTYDITFV